MCLFVDHVREPCKTAEKIKTPFAGGEGVTQVDPKNHVGLLDGGPRSPMGMDNSAVGVVRPIAKHCQSLGSCTLQKIYNCITLPLLQRTAMLQTVGITYCIHCPRGKSALSAMRPFVKVL